LKKKVERETMPSRSGSEKPRNVALPRHEVPFFGSGEKARVLPRKGNTSGSRGKKIPPEEEDVVTEREGTEPERTLELQ